MLPEDRLVFTYRSRYTLEQVVMRMLEYSNNFIANQLFIFCGASRYAAPGTREKGVLAAQLYARNELGLGRITIAEGSGISRQNKISAAAMMKILVAFEPHHALMRNKGRVYFKTGHLKGVRTQAGYYQDPERGLYRYVVLLNTPGKSANPVVDSLLRALEGRD